MFFLLHTITLLSFFFKHLVSTYRDFFMPWTSTKEQCYNYKVEISLGKFGVLHLFMSIRGDVCQKIWWVNWLVCGCFQFRQLVEMWGWQIQSRCLIHKNLTNFLSCNVLYMCMFSIKQFNSMFCWTNQSFKIFFVHICTQEWIKHFYFLHFNMRFCACAYWVWPLKIVSILPKHGNIFIHTLPQIGEYN